jgi:hypothetical protein
MSKKGNKKRDIHAKNKAKETEKYLKDSFAKVQAGKIK